MPHHTCVGKPDFSELMAISPVGLFIEGDRGWYETECSNGDPLYSADTVAALTERREKAERERDEANDRWMNSVHVIQPQYVECIAAEQKKVKDLTDRLAASQLQNEKMRQKFSLIEVATLNSGPDEVYRWAVESLALPSDLSALNAMRAEWEKRASEWGSAYANVCCDKAEALGQVSTLTTALQEAREGLEYAASALFHNGNIAAQEIVLKGMFRIDAVLTKKEAT